MFSREFSTAMVVTVVVAVVVAIGVGVLALLLFTAYPAAAMGGTAMDVLDLVRGSMAAGGVLGAVAGVVAYYAK